MVDTNKYNDDPEESGIGFTGIGKRIKALDADGSIDDEYYDPNASYNLIFTGEILSGYNSNTAKEQLCEYLNITYYSHKGGKIFSNQKLILFTNLSIAEAKDHIDRIACFGIVCQIEEIKTYDNEEKERKHEETNSTRIKETSSNPQTESESTTEEAESNKQLYENKNHFSGITIAIIIMLSILVAGGLLTITNSINKTTQPQAQYGNIQQQERITRENEIENERLRRETQSITDEINKRTNFEAEQYKREQKQRREKEIKLAQEEEAKRKQQERNEVRWKQQERNRADAENEIAEGLRDEAEYVIDFVYKNDFPVLGVSYKIEDVTMEKKYQGVMICYIKKLSNDIMIVADANGYVYLKYSNGNERNSLRRWK